jgi:esterase/lipase superfamily enzyme
LQDQRAFLAQVNAAVARQPADQREAFVFVHGFNTNFAEGLYRQAQMRHDFQTPGLGIHFAWPSAARVQAYATDRETALIARDGLQDLLVLLAQSDVTRIVVMGHSMGALVAMESLRQIGIAQDSRVLGKIDSVVLMAPDLDIEVFRRQMAPLAEHNIKVYVFTSSRDRALRLSALLRGTTDRLGIITDTGPLQGLPVTVIDLSSLEAESDALNHFKAATSPALISLISGMGTVGLRMFRDQPSELGLVEAGVGLVTETTTALTDPSRSR